MTRTLNLIFLLLWFYGLPAQSPIYLTNGNLRAQFSESGATTPEGPGNFLQLLDDREAGSLMYEAGLLISGVDAGGNIKNYTTRGDVTMGIIGLETEITEPWRVSSDDIVAHLADFADNGVIDNPLASIYAWPGFGNSFSEEYNGFALPMTPGITLGQYIHVDQDGRYDPSQRDYPTYFVRGCNDGPPDVANLFPTEMIFFPYALSPN